MNFKPDPSFFRQLFRPIQTEDNTVSDVFSLLRRYKVKVTLTFIREYLKSHPDYPSLKSVCDLFDYLSIEYYPVKAEKEDLLTFNDPFLVHLKEGQGKIVNVLKSSPSLIIYEDGSGKRIKKRTDDFLKSWSGVIILINPTDTSGEPDYSKMFSKEILQKSLIPYLIIATSFLILYGSYFGNLSEGSDLPVIFYLLIFTKLTGLFFSIQLFIHELDLKTSFAEKLCHLSTNIDCNSVTKSKASSIYGDITWADAGITFFISGLIALFTCSFHSILSLYAVLALAAVPYPVFSIYYQAFIVKKWCPLCLSVQAVLLLEFILLVWFLDLSTVFTPDTIKTGLIIMIVFPLVWLLKNYYLKDKENRYFRISHKRLVRNPSIFISQFRKDDHIELNHYSGGIILGNAIAPITISVFLSFHCSACKNKFEEIDNLLRTNKNLKFSLFFSPSSDGATSTLIKQIFENNELGLMDANISLLKEWFLNRKKPKVASESSDNVMIDSKIISFNENLRKIYSDLKISAVPTVLINGYPFPQMFKLDDIRYHIESFIQFENSQREKVLIG